jgi:hypothetical protein
MQSFNPNQILINSLEYQARFFHWGEIYGLAWVERSTHSLVVVDLFDDESEWLQYQPNVLGWEDDAVQIIDTFQFTLIPTTLLDSLNTTQVAEQIGIPNSNKAHVFRLPQTDFSFLYDYQSGRNEPCIPLISKWIYPLLEKSHHSNDPIFLADFRNRNFHLLVAHNGKLLLANSFHYQESTDALFHLLNTIQSLSIDNQKVTLFISGTLVSDSELWKLMDRYVLQIFPYSGNRIQTIDFFNHTPVQYWAPLNVLVL